MSSKTSVKFPSIKAVASALVTMKPGKDAGPVRVHFHAGHMGWEVIFTNVDGYVLDNRTNTRDLAKRILDDARTPALAPTMPTADQRTEEGNVIVTDDDGEQYELIEHDDFGSFLDAVNAHVETLPPDRRPEMEEDAVMLATADDIVETSEADTVLLTPEELPTVAISVRVPTADHPDAHAVKAILDNGGEGLRRFARAYVECALWTGNDESAPDGGKPLDANYDVRDVHPSAMLAMLKECEEFLILCEEDIATWEGPMGRTRHAEEAAGHDFFLTRNGHGSGFLDGDWAEESGRRLADAAHCYGEVFLYVGDDGLLHIG